MSQLPPSDPQASTPNGGETSDQSDQHDPYPPLEAGIKHGSVALPPLMLAPALSAIGLALLVIYGLSVLHQLLPVRLLMPAWQLRLAGVLLENGLWPLLGLGLLQLAAYLDPEHIGLQARWQNLGRLGVIAVLGFLLLIPLQLVATARALQTMDITQQRQQRRVEGNLNRMREQIKASASFPDLQNRIRDIQAPDLVIDPQTLRQPLPQIKRALLASVDQSEQQLRRRFQAQTSRSRTWALLQRSGRGVLMALVLAVAYAAATPSWSDPEVSLLMLLQQSLLMRQERRRLRRQDIQDVDYIRQLLD